MDMGDDILWWTHRWNSYVLPSLFFSFEKKNPPFLTPLMTIAGPCVPFAHGLGRIGCFLDGCCYGKETDSIFGIKFTTTTTKVWPTNLFEAIFLLVLASGLFYLAYRHRSRYTFPIYMMSYGVFRFLIEFLRGDHRGSFIPGISFSVLGSSFILRRYCLFGMHHC